MLKDILICLEGSSSSERAIDLGLELGREHGARLVGLAIIDEADIRAGSAVGGASDRQQRDDTLLEDARHKTAETLAHFQTRCQQGGVATRTLELRGRPATILEEMTEHDLTLIGRKANFLFETKDEDAKTRDNVLHNARKPVMVVPEEVAKAGHDVLIAYDGSSAAKRAVRAFGERLTEMLWGSVTREMIEKTQVPLFLHH
jgi:nucleotide-binding universal stress UspA family protein